MAATPARVTPSPAAVFQGELSRPTVGSSGPSPNQRVTAVCSVTPLPPWALVRSTRTAAGARGCRRCGDRSETCRISARATG